MRGHVVLRRQRIRGTECDVGAASLERDHQVGRLGRHVQAGTHPYPGQRPLGGEPLADLPQDRHRTLGPFRPRTARVRESERLHIVVRGVPSLRATHCACPFSGRHQFGSSSAVVANDAAPGASSRPVGGGRGSVLDRTLERAHAIGALPRELRAGGLAAAQALGRAAEMSVRRRRAVDRLAQIERGDDARAA